MHGLQVQQGATLALVQVQILPGGLGEGGLKPPQETRNPDDKARPGIRLASQQRNYGWHYFDDGQDSAQDSDPDKDIMVQYVNVQPRTRTVKNVETLWDRRGDDRDGEHRYNNKLGDNILDFANDNGWQSGDIHLPVSPGPMPIPPRIYKPEPPTPTPLLHKLEATVSSSYSVIHHLAMQAEFRKPSKSLILNRILIRAHAC
jgi:hypothetical protein